MPTNHHYFRAIGRRKTAHAQIHLTRGTGKFTVNDRVVNEIDKSLLKPFVLCGQTNQFDVSVIVRGGGFSAQKQAIVHGIARALVLTDNVNRQTLRKAGLLTRDPRVKERKKPGLKRARRAPQWQKR